MNSFCVEQQQPYVNIGYINDISVIGPFYIPGETGCFRCASVAPEFDGQNQNKFDKLNSGFKAATFAPVNGVAASYAAGDIIKFLGKFAEVQSINKRIGIHSAIAKIETQPLDKNEECKICGTR